MSITAPVPFPSAAAVPVTPHAVSRLRTARLARSTRPFLARGGPKGERCEGCRLRPSHCLCALRPNLPTQAGFCLLMHDAEPMKPSNTGWLIADVVQETFAFGWSRVEVDAGLQALLRDPQWQPYVVFPGEFVEPPERVIHTLPEEAVGTMDAAQHGKRPLFILLDATWNEARKMFRKSPYLNDLPVLSLQPEQISHYKLRRSNREDHFCTSEVAALCLQMCRDARDVQAGHVLEHYLTVYTHHYLRAKSQLPPEPEGAAHQGLAAALRQTQPS